MAEAGAGAGAGLAGVAEAGVGGDSVGPVEAGSGLGPVGVGWGGVRPEGVGGRGGVRVVELDAGARVVVRRVVASAGVPQFGLALDVDMTGCERLRREVGDAGGTPVPSYNDMVVKAAALALRQFPRVNAAFVDGTCELYERVNVGVAVDADDALLVPTVFDADRLPLTEIARTTARLAERVRGGTITPAELDGGTFTISNLGMYGVVEFAALVHPPQAAILAVGEIRTVADFADGRPVPRRVMRATLTCDHRIVYGARAARFLARVRELLERPVALLLGPPDGSARERRGVGP